METKLYLNMFEDAWWHVRTWEDFGGLVSTCLSLGIIVSICLAVRQISSAQHSSRTEMSIDICVRLSERFEELTTLRNTLDHRVSQSDKTVTRAQYGIYFIRFWSQQVEQFDYFAAGLIPPRIYLVWMLYLVRKLNGETEYSYFDDAGTLSSINSAEVYDLYCKQSSLVNYQTCVAFFDALKAIRLPAPGNESGDAYKRQRELIRRAMLEAKAKGGIRHWPDD